MKSKFLLAAAALLLLDSAAWAAPYTVVASGTIVELEENALAFDASIEVATPFSVELSFDTDAPDSAPGDPELGYYVFAAPPYSLHVEVGDYAFDAGSGGFSIGVSNYLSGYLNIYVLDEIATGTVPPGTSVGLTPMNLFDSSAAITSDALDPLLFDLTRWDGFEFVYSAFDGPSYVYAFGELDSLTLTAVPEPASGTLLLCGLVALARRRGRSAA